MLRPNAKKEQGLIIYKKKNQEYCLRLGWKGRVRNYVREAELQEGEESNKQGESVYG